LEGFILLRRQYNYHISQADLDSERTKLGSSKSSIRTWQNWARWFFLPYTAGLMKNSVHFEQGGWFQTHEVS
jgi:hypothetical protein